jgi:N utilization substance protein B
MTSRRKSREMALQILYQMDFVDLAPEKAIDVFCSSFATDDLDCEFIARLVTGVLENMDAIDRILSGISSKWRLDRMCTTDRNILRMSAFEIRYCADIPPKVTISEAVEIGKRFGTEESGAFINGLLHNLITQAGGLSPPEGGEGP